MAETWYQASKQASYTFCFIKVLKTFLNVSGIAFLLCILNMNSSNFKWMTNNNCAESKADVDW